MNDVNREVAEKVMGWEVLDVDCIPGERLMWASREVDSIGYKYFKPQITVKDFDPLHKIEHAWMVVEKFESWEVYKGHVFDRNEKDRYMVRIWTEPGTSRHFSSDWQATAQEAICKAALAVLAAKEGE